MNVTVFWVIALAVTVGGIALQVFLSRREGKWPGLVLPGIAFAYSLFTVLNLLPPDGMTGWDVFGMVGATLLAMNIPTVILLAIYLGCHEKHKRERALEKMSIQDLE